MMMHHLMIIFILWSSYTVGQDPKCEEPPDIDFGEKVNDGKGEYYEGDRVKYQCSPGTTLMGSEWIECHEKNWTPLPKCSAPCTVTKQELEEKKLALSNGQRRSVIILNNQSLEFSCADGYTLTKPSLRTCMDGHMDFPTCILVRPCDYPEIENGRIYKPFWQSEEYQRNLFPASIGKEMHFHCNENYVPTTGRSSTFWTSFSCTAEGWSPTPKCLRECLFSGLAHGHFWPRKVFHKQGDEIKVQCDYGYSLPNNQEKIICTKQGWSTEPMCKRSEVCILNNTVDNGYFSEAKQVYLVYTIARYQCKEGYTTTDGKREGSITCGQQGWLDQPKCIKDLKKCAPPPTINNGDITSFPLTEYAPASTVEYRCQRFYMLKGSPVVTCRNGLWTEEPTCLRIPCGKPPSIQYGIIPNELDTYEFGEEVTYRCLEGFSIDGPATIKCIGGNWPNPPQCKESHI
ncbi:complement factor H-related protein 3-like isoform X1 [Macrotis lagotis]|uniref:complement factor H-related protein 3-like isoform X1 n=1 Tax=Macrotis lagotis TaxID=92651 RepID=UPI003D69FD02